ncbi:MAG TPA: aminotransferase class V-fold PLP-dependent enzyme [Bacteroidia bacterium]|jgi:isopenicillin-N epimerase|nr:aminotransferase class V-fold PLP-dependent enzyme [Bacteroidia bacterium]
MPATYSPLIKHWSLEQKTTFLNHGSFGATPTAVLEEQRRSRDQMEAQPVRFFIREFEPLWDDARKTTAEFLGTEAGNLVFVTNTTMGVNAVFHSLEFNEGDEILTHDHAYGACLNTLNYYSAKKKFNVCVANIPFPIKNEDEILESLLKGVTPKTKMLFIDHITSASGIIFPVKKIASAFRAKGISVFVDGAHAPGMIDLNIDELDVDYYVGNAHKWICSPKGSAMLYVHPSRQKEIVPLQISHNYDRTNEWAKQFFWPGTADYSAYLAVPEAIRFMGTLFPGGWNELRKNNRELTLRGRKMIADALGTELPAPDNMIGHLANILIGKTELPEYGFNNIHPIQEKLFSEYNIEVPIFIFKRSDPKAWVRIACQCYNDISQYEYLAQALKEIVA